MKYQNLNPNYSGFSPFGEIGREVIKTQIPNPKAQIPRGSVLFQGTKS
jgi:hypothetical protein